MHPLFDSLAALRIDNGGVLFLDVVLKATLLLLLAGGASVLLRRRAAALRHRVWCLAFCGLLILPLLTTFLPGWRLPILPPPADVTAATDAASAAPITEPSARDLATESVAETDPLSDPSTWNTDHPFNLERAQMAWETMPPSQTSATVPPPNVVERPAEDALPPRSVFGSDRLPDDAAATVRWGTIVCWLWLLGAGLAIWPLLAGFVRNGALHRAARTFDDPAAGEWIHTLCASLGLRRRVRLLETGRAIVPMTWGILRPIVLFPVAWREWTQKRRRLVLLHELAHVKRCDVAFQLMARLACALYWFHPLAWYALRRLRIERELACDDCVLMTGARPSEYAQELLDIARHYQSLALPTTVAMAQTSNLEHRIRALLDHARPHLPLSRTAARFLLLAAIVLVTGVAVVRPSARETIAAVDDESAIDNARDVTSTNAPAPEGTASDHDVDGGNAAPHAAEGTAKRQAAEGADQPPAEDVTFHYRGRVLNPQDQPVADARMYFVYWVHGTRQQRDVEPVALSDADGWFDFTATPADIGAGAESAYASNFSFPLVAIADGYGFAEQLSPVFETTGNVVDRLPAAQREYYEQRFKGAEPVLRLVKDDVPIRGRVVNTEGRPLAGVRVAVDGFWYNEEGSLDAWEGAAKEDKADFYSLRQHTPHITNGPQMRSVIPDVTTDADGRFTLRGIGRERIVQVLISGPGIETNQVKARTRDGEMIEVPNTSQRERGPDNREAYHPAEFTHVAAASIPVIGRITDADSGEPIADVTVSAGQSATFLSGGKYWITTSTDADGRYRLEGLPIGSAEDIYVLPPDDSPYLPASRRVKTRLGEDADAQDFVLKQGLWVRGQAVDARTGEPLPGRAQYYVDSGNPHLEEYAAFARGFVIHERRADANGRFAIPVLPGRGIITFMPDDHSKYRRGVGAETITIPGEIFDVKRQSKSFKVKPSMLSSGSEAILHEINPPVDSEPLEIVLRPVSGMEVVGKLLDPDGRPLTEGRIQVVGAPLHYPRFDTNQHVFRLEAYFPDEPCEVFFFHVERNLAGSLRLEGEPPESLTVTLHPAGSVRGRLIDDAGIPLSGVSLTGVGIPTQNYGDADLRLATDDDGRFHIRGLIPGRKYTVEARGDRHYGRVLLDESVDTPETKDVGDVTLQPPDPTKIFPSPAATPTPPKQPASQKTSSNAPERTARPQAAAVMVTGKVLLPNGEAAAGATVRAGVSMWAMLEPIVGEDYELPVIETMTDAEGNFTIAIPTQPYGDLSRLDERWQEIWKETSIAASLPGYGGQWVRYKDIEADGPITLKLVEDLPVNGRVIDLEGRPIADIEVQIGGPCKAENEDLSTWIEAAKDGELPWTLIKHAPSHVEPKLISVPESVRTAGDGRFEIRGMGRERQFDVVFKHDTVAHQNIGIVTRAMEPIQRVINTPPFEGHEPVFGAQFTFTAAPSRPIVGTVRDADTGEPLPGVHVESYKLAGYPFSNHRVLKTVTDEQGRFKLTGMPKADGNKLLVLPNDEQPYLIQQVDVPNPLGLGPAILGVGLHRGIWITGRVTDKATGEPVHARLYYLPYRSNEYAQAVPEFDDDGNSHSDQLRYQTRPDGTYRLVGLPGRAVVGAQSVLKEYRYGVGYDEINGPKDRDDHLLTYKNPLRPSPKWPNVMAEIDPPADAHLVTVDLQMDPGVSVPIRMVGPDDQPVSNVQVTGATSLPRTRVVEKDRFEATQFAPNEIRALLFHCTDRSLGWVARISARDSNGGVVTIKLRPVATLTARLLHEDGSPMRGAILHANLRPSIDFAPDLPKAVTDENGRLNQTLLPGSSYSLHAEGAEINLGAGITRELSVEPGQSIDLGDLRLVGDKFEPVAMRNGEDER